MLTRGLSVWFRFSGGEKEDKVEKKKNKSDKAAEQSKGGVRIRPNGPSSL